MRQHPIIALWSHPRSMSTAIERIMRERGDLTCFHEPFMHYYYSYLGVKEMPHSELDPGCAMDFDAVLEQLRTAARSSAVFFKDMSYYIVPAPAFEHVEFAREVQNVFLIRDPRKSLLSYYKLDPKLRLEEVGLEAQWRHASWLRERTGRPPLVIEAEAVTRDPRAVLSALWTSVGLRPAPHAFQWKSHEVPSDWRQVAGWHDAVSRSAGIEQAEPEDDAAIRGRFDAAVAGAPVLADYLEHHWPYYERLRQMARGS